MKFHVMLEFILDEDVSPEHLALRVAQACVKYGALREGESVATIAEKRAHVTAYTVSNEATRSPFA